MIQGAKLSGTGGLSGQEGADCPQRPCGQSGQVSWTVRPGAADSPLKPTEPLEMYREKRTICEDQADRPRGIRTVRYWSSDRPQTSCNKNLKQNRIENEDEHEHDEHCARRLSTRHTRTVRASRTEAKTARPRRSTPPAHHRISQTVEAVETRVWGHDMRQTRMLYPKTFAS
jgi:hypothetical protein